MHLDIARQRIGAPKPKLTPDGDSDEQEESDGLHDAVRVLQESTFWRRASASDARALRAGHKNPVNAEAKIRERDRKT